MTADALDRIFQSALQHQRTGLLSEAEGEYRLVLQHQPTHGGALHMLGVIASQVGRHETAITLFRRVLELNPRCAEAYADLSFALRSTGQFREALAACQLAVELKPEYAEGFNNLGVVLYEMGDLQSSVSACRKALDLNPSFPEAHNNLGNALRAQKCVEESIHSYRQAVHHNPCFTEAWNNLGSALIDAKQWAGSVEASSMAIALQPLFSDAHCNLGIGQKNLGDLAGASANFRRAIELDPCHAEACNNLGAVMEAMGEIDRAIEAYREAVQIKPSSAEACNNLGAALRLKGDFDAALLLFEEALRLKPDFAEAYDNLGIALDAVLRSDEAVAAFRQALRLDPYKSSARINLANLLCRSGKVDEAVDELQNAVHSYPDSADAHSTLAYCLTVQGRVEDALISYDTALKLRPDDLAIQSSRLFLLHFDSRSNAITLAREHRKWGQRFTESGILPRGHYANDPSRGRRLRIGYLSPDFRYHVVGLNLLSILGSHDKVQFETFCYSNVACPDRVTSRLRNIADHWRDISTVGDCEVAEIIAGDGIDILVDLALHTSGNRLPVFARKPAPLQVTYLGYCGTSGLVSMDYRFSDDFLDPLGADLSVYSEQTIRLPNSYWCYNPPEEARLPIRQPASSDGDVLFGCLNNFSKVSTEVLELWVEILRRVPQSRLLLNVPEGTCRSRVLSRFEAGHVSSERIRFVGRQPFAGYYHSLGGIDIALDSFPYGGGITTCDAIWLGVPVITLSGQTAVGRGGRSILSVLGLQELIAEDREEYAGIAVSLAMDAPRLMLLRAGLRERMENSPLCDIKGQVRDIEAAFRKIWSAWCMGRSAHGG